MGATPGQVALAWLLLRQPWIVPIPGTRRAERIVENNGAAAVALSADDLAELTALADRVGVRGNRYGEEHMALVEHWSSLRATSPQTRTSSTLP